MATAAILCSEVAGGLWGRALMRAPQIASSPTEPSTLARHLKAEKFTTRIEKRHWRCEGPWRDAWLWASMERRARTACVSLKGGGLGSGAYCAEKDHRPSLAATQCAARLRGCRQARQLYCRRQRAADFAKRPVAACHRARAPHRRAALRAPAACTHAHQGRPAFAAGGGEVLRSPRVRAR